MNNSKNIDRIIEGIAAGESVLQLEVEAQNIDLNAIGIRGRTPLMVAAAEGLLAVVEMLVRNGASVNVAGRGEMTALHEACATGEVAVANFLLSIGAEIDAETVDGVTPLMCTAAWGNCDAAMLLLEHRADSRKRERSGATASDIAREKEEASTANLIDSFAAE